MKVVAMIPYWEQYKFPDKNIINRDTLNIGGHSLLERMISICNQVEEIEETVIYSSNEQALDSLDKGLSFNFQKRSTELDGQHVSIEDIIERFLLSFDTDVMVLVHPRCPFIKPSSIADCVRKVCIEHYDSAFIATQYKKLAWFNGKPLNYSLKKGESTTNVSDIEPVILESSSVYVFTKSLFNKTRRRISKKPFVNLVGSFEGFDIESVDDYEIADLILNAGLDI